MKIPGVSFSLKRAVGITAAKQKIARKTGIPITKGGLERKVGRLVMNGLLGSKKKKVTRNEGKDKEIKRGSCSCFR